MWWVGLFPPPSAPTQPPSWAWETSRRNWTAYPAERRTQTCPTPTRRPPPTARTHEGNAVPPPPPCSSSLPSFLFLPLALPPNSTSVILHVSCPSTLCSQPPRCCIDARRERGMWGGAGVDARFCLPVIPELPVHTPTSLFPLLHFFSTWPLHLRGTIFFFTVAYETVCYVRVDGGTMKGRRNE